MLSPDQSPLQQSILKACSEGNINEVRSLQSQLQSAQESVPIEEMIAIAAGQAHDQIVSYCIQHGADVYNRLTITAALGNGRTSTFETLISAGLDPNRNLDYEGNALLLRTSADDLNFVKFLVAHGADVNTGARLMGRDRLLQVAARRASPELMLFLLGKGCALENSGALQRASGVGRLEMVACLLNAGAAINEIPEGYGPKAKRRQRGTALHEAVGNGHVELVKYLLEKGADRDLVDSFGKLAIERVEECKIEEDKAQLIRLLELPLTRQLPSI